jgi:hypothetical protein
LRSKFRSTHKRPMQLQGKRSHSPARSSRTRRTGPQCSPGVVATPAHLATVGLGRGRRRTRLSTPPPSMQLPLSRATALAPLASSKATARTSCCRHCTTRPHCSSLAARETCGRTETSRCCPFRFVCSSSRCGTWSRSRFHSTHKRPMPLQGKRSHSPARRYRTRRTGPQCSPWVPATHLRLATVGLGQGNRRTELSVLSATTLHALARLIAIPRQQPQQTMPHSATSGDSICP